MVTYNGSITLNGVTDKEMELIWGFKAKHENQFVFFPNSMQTQAVGNGVMVYNNVNFQYNTLSGINLITEIVNELQRKDPKAAS